MRSKTAKARLERHSRKLIAALVERLKTCRIEEAKQIQKQISEEQQALKKLEGQCE